jgi:diaminohydroxyphosphoribosylaminopyrimidine deaminase/5-amino-6-(5-phosphoribosylamino)uracil reductase
MAGRVFDDRHWMRRAVEIGSRGSRLVRPNPRVGCVLVRGGVEVGAGLHRQVGGPHAEVEALRAAGENARGATAYVTLEPCNHHGRTPPCSQALIAAGVTRVVVGAADPHPLAQGGAAALREAGVLVTEAVEVEACQRLAEVFFVNLLKKRAFVQLKLASTLDGRVAARDGTSQWITGPAARLLVHRWRSESDAVLIGSGTALADDPRLDLRLLPPRVVQQLGSHRPMRVVVDRRGQLHPGLQLADTAQQRTLVFTTAQGLERLGPLQAQGVDLAVLPDVPDLLQLTHLLEELFRRGICHLLCEGGPALATALLRAGLVDRFDLLQAPKLLGSGPAAVGDLGIASIGEALGLHIDETHRVGDDLHVAARPVSRKELHVHGID